MDKIIYEPLKLVRKDGKLIIATYYDNSDINEVEILNIKQLKFEGIVAKNIKKADIHNVVLKNKGKIYLQNKRSRIAAGLSKKHLNKIISTVFSRDIENRFSYLKKELISNVDLIFYFAIPIIKHPELKKQALYNIQDIHRFCAPIKIGGLFFLAMITIKERKDYKEAMIDEFSIYDIFSKNSSILNQHSCSINILIDFVKTNLIKQYQK